MATNNTQQNVDISNLQFDFRDDNLALFDFEDDGTDFLWVYDRKNGIYRPFESAQAVANYYLMDPAVVEASIEKYPLAVKDLPGMDGTFINNKYMVKNSGAAAEEPQIASKVTGLSGLYGSSKKDVASEAHSGKLIDALFTRLKNSGAISQETFNETLGNPTELAKFINATTYGGYNIGDIYKDVKASELFKNGNQAYQNFKGFSETASASQWKSSEEGKKASFDSVLQAPKDLDIDSDLFNYPIFSIPDKAFKTLVKPLDWNSPEFKEEAEKIQASWFDISTQMSEASTQQEKANAQQSWANFREDLDKKYGIQLSQDARTAWSQFQQITSGFNARNLGNSGLYQEAMDKHFRDVQRQGQLLRDAKVTTEERSEIEMLQKTGNPEQIAAYIKAHPDKAALLTPSKEIAEWFSVENLKKLYPDMTDAELKAIHDIKLDEAGNYRSNLYENLYTNRYDLGEQKKTYQQTQLAEQQAYKEKQAEAAFTKTDGLSSYVPPGSSTEDVVDGGSANTTPKTDYYSNAPTSISPMYDTSGKLKIGKAGTADRWVDQGQLQAFLDKGFKAFSSSGSFIDSSKSSSFNPPQVKTTPVTPPITVAPKVSAPINPVIPAPYKQTPQTTTTIPKLDTTKNPFSSPLLERVFPDIYKTKK